jgi:hypothetical protein
MVKYSSIVVIPLQDANASDKEVVRVEKALVIDILINEVSQVVDGIKLAMVM